MKEMTGIRVKNLPVMYLSLVTAKSTNSPVNKNTIKMTNLRSFKKITNKPLKLINPWISVSKTSHLPSTLNLNSTWPLTSGISDLKKPNPSLKHNKRWNSTSPNFSWPKPNKFKIWSSKRSTTTKKRKSKEISPSNKKSTKKYKSNWRISGKKLATK